jgi:hypothetical protein
MLLFLISMSLLPAFCSAGSDMLAEITEDVTTDFGVYHPVLVNFTPAVPEFTPNTDFGNVTNYDKFRSEYREGEREALLKYQFTVRYSRYKQMFDIYVASNWEGLPIFVTSDAVLHIYHVLFDQMLARIETVCFVDTLNSLTRSLIDATDAARTTASLPKAQEALFYNLAFLSVADQLLNRNPKPVPAEMDSLVSAELGLVEQHDGFHYSPIFGNFSMLDYSQFIPRGHYTKNDTLKSYFKAMMWYGWTIFTMEPGPFGDLARRHTLQAVLLVQMLCRDVASFDRWERLYDPTVFFVGKTDDPNVYQYRQIAEQIYGPNFLSLSPDTLADSLKVEAFMAEAQKLPAPKIPNYNYPNGFPYRGFRFMGQRFIPDSYLFASVVDPIFRPFPRGLDVMAALGSDRALTLLDSVFHDNTHFKILADFRAEFAGLPSSDWAQNLYWNWLYCLMPLLTEKGAGYPFFMQTIPWMDKELMAALASWAELRHDTILYAKQSGTTTGEPPVPPAPPRNYVEPNPSLYARLTALVQFTRDGLESRGLLFESDLEKLNLFHTMLVFFKNVSVKELENQPLTQKESDLIAGFGDAMRELVSAPRNPERPWETPPVDNMAVVADVHTDQGSLACLEEGVGYPLEVDVIVYENGEARICRGALFSYHEFTQPISNRLTDEQWREMLVSEAPPDMPEWAAALVAPGTIRTIPSDDYGMEIAYPNRFSGVAASPVPKKPDTFRLIGIYPNPFNPSTTIRFELPEEALVAVVVYDLNGRMTRSLLNTNLHVGTHEFLWDGRDDLGRSVASGLYFVQIKANETRLTGKISLLK